MIKQQKRSRDSILLTEEAQKITRMKVGLDYFYYKLVQEDSKYEDLGLVMMVCFILSHGNASVASVFSINKHLVVENLLEDSLVSKELFLMQ